MHPGAQEKYVNALGTEKVRLLRLAVNNGKGGAVRKGMVRGDASALVPPPEWGLDRSLLCSPACTGKLY